MKVFLITVSLLCLVAAIFWFGLQIPPRPFPALSANEGEHQFMSLPDQLPDPVDRFYRKLYGEQVPRITSAVVSGRGTMRIRGISFPARFRFIHDAGSGYRHYIQATWFGLPLMTVNEYFLDGVGRMELPFGTIEDEPQVNQGANLGMWAESIWFPSLFLTDERVRWQAVDEHTAALVVPYEEEEQVLIARFDPESGLLRHLESMRYKGAESERKVLWINEARAWEEQDGFLTVTGGAITWFDEGTPWFVFEVEEIRTNVDVGKMIRDDGS